MSVRIARRFVTIAGSALMVAALVSGASVAIAATTGTTKASLAAPTVRDVNVLVARENAVVAQLKAFRRLGKTVPVAQWEARLKATEAAQATAEATLNADLVSAPSGKAPAPISHVLFSVTGSGQSSTQPFTVPASVKQWELQWHYDCSSTGSEGNFDYYVEQGTAIDFNDSGPNQLGTGGSGTEHYYDTGTFHLNVNSECAWSISVTG